MTDQNVQIHVEIEDHLLREIKGEWHVNKMDWNTFMEMILRLGLKHHKNGERDV